MLQIYVLRRQPKLFYKICVVRNQHFAFMLDVGIEKCITLRAHTETLRVIRITTVQGMKGILRHSKRVGTYKLLAGMIKPQRCHYLIIIENLRSYHWKFVKMWIFTNHQKPLWTKWYQMHTNKIGIEICTVQPFWIKKYQDLLIIIICANHYHCLCSVGLFSSHYCYVLTLCYYLL